MGFEIRSCNVVRYQSWAKGICLRRVLLLVESDGPIVGETDGGRRGGREAAKANPAARPAGRSSESSTPSAVWTTG